MDFFNFVLDLIPSLGRAILSFGLLTFCLFSAYFVTANFQEFKENHFWHNTSWICKSLCVFSFIFSVLAIMYVCSNYYLLHPTKIEIMGGSRFDIWKIAHKEAFFPFVPFLVISFVLSFFSSFKAEKECARKKRIIFWSIKTVFVIIGIYCFTILY